ncbi:MAG: glycosyltransferase family 39 protein, partial [Planctomycetota bacterium]
MDEKKPLKKIIRSEGTGIGLAIFLLAALVRAVYLYDSSDNPTFFAPIVDSLTYDQMARELVNGGSLTHEFFWQPLFYPLFLSLVYKLSSSSILVVKIVQAILGCLTSVLVYVLGKKLFGKRAGVLAGVITAIYIPLVFFEGELLAVGWAAFWSVALVLILIKVAKKLSVWSCFVLGLCGGLSIITRPVFLPFFTAGFIWLMVVWIRRHIDAKRLVLGVLTVAIGFSAIALPAAYLSYRVVGKASILPYSGGINLYIGNNPNYRETITIRPGLAWRKLTELPTDYGIKDRFEKERFFSNKALNYIRTQPTSFMKGLMYKTTQFLSSREMPRNVDIYLFRKWSPLLALGVFRASGFGFPFGLLLPLAVGGVVFTWRKVPVPIWLFLIFYPASVILVFVTSRYRMPAIPVLSILAAAGCAELWKILQSHQGKKLLAAAVIFLGVAVASSAVGPFYAEQVDYEPELYYGLADSLDKHGNVAKAIDAYLRAIRLRSNYV